MIESYKNNYSKYLKDQMTKFESFEGQLYSEGIKKTVEYILSDYNSDFNTVLDFCCGDGTTTKAIHDLGFDVEGFDGNINKIREAQRVYPDMSFFCLEVGDIEEIHSKYDIVYASHCFEHFLDPVEVLKQVKKNLLRYGGEIILILPYPNEESEGHPGSGELWLDKDIPTIKRKFKNLGFDVPIIDQINIRESELLIILK